MNYFTYLGILEVIKGNRKIKPREVTTELIDEEIKVWLVFGIIFLVANLSYWYFNPTKIPIEQSRTTTTTIEIVEY